MPDLGLPNPFPEIGMIWLALLLAGAAVLILVLRRAMTDPRRRNLARGVAIVAGLLSLVCLVRAVFVAVPAGHVGVPVVFGKVRNYHLSEGLHIVNPFAQVHMLSARTETYTMSAATVHTDYGSGYGGSIGKRETRVEDAINAVTSDGLSMVLDVTIAYRLVPEDGPWVYRHLGDEYVDKIVRPAARTAVREATSKFTSQEAYSTRREELAVSMQDLLVARIKNLLGEYQSFTGTGFVIQQVMVRSVELPASVKAAIEEKLSAEQAALKMQFVLQKQTQEAERMRIEAQGIADFQKIVSQGLSEPLLRWKGIEATMKLSESNNAKVVIIGSGPDGLPLILNTGEAAK
jgi:regulator of protease activity HflC (stomatin/prohibitin superfamily)